MPNITINNLPKASTIDPTQDYVPIYTASSTSTQGINRNTLLNLASAPVGLTDNQTLTNKVLTSPTISGPTLSGTLGGTYTIGGTPTFPSSVVQLTSSQTLTNKTLTSPTITSPTITNAAITADTVSGYTNSSNGTIYGMSVTSGVLASAALVGSVNTAAITANAVTSPKLGLSHALDATNGVQSQSNAGSAGGTIYYINLGGLKMAWGLTGALTITGSAPASNAYVITWPTSFFTTIQMATVSATPGNATNTQYIYTAPDSAATTTSWTFYLAQASGSTGGTSQASFFAIGT